MDYVPGPAYEFLPRLCHVVILVGLGKMLWLVARMPLALNLTFHFLGSQFRPEDSEVKP